MAVKSFSIKGKKIGGKRTFIIAEAGVNHNGSLSIAKELIYQAKKCGADAVKFQSFRADYMCIRELKEKKDIKGITKGSVSAYDMYKALELSEKAHFELIKFARKEKIIFLTSVFDVEMVDFLKKAGVDGLKIASGDITYKQLIIKAVKSGLPVFVSTGMADEEEINLAVRWAKKAGAKKFSLLHCVSLYPPKSSEVNLNFILGLRKSYNFPIGFSDHTIGFTAVISAVALGSKIIEKHFTLDSNMKGPDHKLSMNPADFKMMVAYIRELEEMLGSEKKRLSQRERMERKNSRRGLKAKSDIKKGDMVNYDNSLFIKPETGIKPFEFDKFYGKKIKKSVKKGKPIFPGYF